MIKKIEILEQIQRLVESVGLIFLGTVRLGEDPDFERFQSWLNQDRHAGMGFLKNHQHLRKDPRGLAENLSSGIIVGLNYYQGDSLAKLKSHGGPAIAQYARLRDYHKVIREHGTWILNQLPDVLGCKVAGRVTTDSAPILERSHAARAGRGFVGKNTCYIMPDSGSFLLLGEILIDVELPHTVSKAPDPGKRSAQGGCGTCQRCQVHCPTGALDEAWNLDANKCLSYWSIEHRGLIPYEYWKWFKIYLFGCDICQLVCPYNRGAAVTPHQKMIRVDAAPELFRVATMSQSEYESMFGGTPLTRAKREGLMRNALIAMAVTDDLRLPEAIRLHKQGSATSAVISGTIQQIAGYKKSQN